MQSLTKTDTGGRGLPGLIAGLFTRSAPVAGERRAGPPDANQSRAATITAGTYDAASHTVDCVLSTGAEVSRFGYRETLAVTPQAIDLSRVKAGQVKILDSHNQGSIGAILGTLLSARIEAGLLVGTIQFADSDAGRAAEAAVASGDVKGVSIGYSVQRWTNVAKSDAGAGAEEWRADAWTLMEASFVAVPADAGAMVRSGDVELTRGAPNSPAPAPMDATRALDLLERAAFFDQRDLAESMVREGKTEAEIMLAVRAACAALADANRRDTGGPNPSIGAERATPEGKIIMAQNARTLDNPDFRREAIEGAIYARMTGKPPEGAAREFMGARLDEIDAILAGRQRRGWGFGGSGLFGARASGMMTTSDFPNLLLGAGNRVLQETYEAALSPLTMLARVRDSLDFRPINILRVSEAPALQKVAESGEVTYGARGEEREAFKVETFARIFSFSRQALANDDLGAFGDFNRAFAQAAAATVADQLAALLTANSGNGATLSDNAALFTTGRGNKAASGSAINTASLSAARKALRETKGLDGKTFLSMRPKYLLVGTAKETEAEAIVAALNPTAVGDVNPFAGKLEVLVEPRLTGNAWRLFADTAQQSVLSMAYLNGRRGPIIETRDGWTTLGMEFRAVLDFGCGVTDWRGGFLDPGN